MDKRILNDIYRPQTQAAGAQKILIVTADDTEDLEFFYPYYRFIEEGFAVDVATPKGGEFKGKHGLPLKNTLKLANITIDDYALLYIPGGKAPAKLVKVDEALAITRSFAQTGKPIISVCHGPQLLAAADVIRGRQIAAWPEVEDEVRKAGATYVNAETITDGQFTTGRWPGDLPALMKRTLEVIGSSENSIRPNATESRAGRYAAH